MFESIRNGNACLPYDDLIMIFFNVGLNLEMKDSIESCTKIRQHTLSQIQIKDDNGVLMHSGPKAKKKDTQQARTSNL